MKKNIYRLWAVVLRLSAYLPTPTGLLTLATVGIGNQAADVVSITANATSTGNDTAQTATANGDAGIITTASVATAAGSNLVVTVTNSRVSAGDRILATLNTYSGSQGLPVLLRAAVTAAPNTFAVTIRNMSAADALDGALSFTYQIGKAVQ
jgi:hypothetical protein